MHFFSGTEQMYLANLEKGQPLRATDTIRLSIEFDDPKTGEPRQSEFSWRADELEMATGSQSKFAARNLNKARMVATFGYQLRHMARSYGDVAAQASKPMWSALKGEAADQREARRREAVVHCRRVKGRLDAFSAQLGGERQAGRVVDLWHRYCERFGDLDEDESFAEVAKEMKLVKLEKELFEPSEKASKNEYEPRIQEF
jgi:hypothetical protein